METNATVVTVSVVDPLMLPDLAVMVAVPEATAAASPLLFLMVATEVFDEFQFAVVVRFWVLPLL